MSIQEAIRNNVPLSPLTTIRLGGPAKHFLQCDTPEMLVDAIRFARGSEIPWTVIGGGSNVIFPDEGFDGLVIRINLRGWQFSEHSDHAVLEAQAGEPWDRLVSEAVAHGFSGVECLSGIPGLVGATPIQNVGAYGQEVSETIQTVRALDLTSLQLIEIPGEACGFGYRTSRFKREDRDRYIVTSVVFRFGKGTLPEIRYAELQGFLEDAGEVSPTVLREAVIALRRKKSMVIDPRDPNCRSVGSFFMNPVVPQHEFTRLLSEWESMPGFRQGGQVKIPAAWLVENAGYPKGFRQGNVGLSSNHALALVNHGGTTAELLTLAGEIQEKVRTVFGIALEPEPVIVGRRPAS